jgi:DNA mismatch repair protein MutS2
MPFSPGEQVHVAALGKAIVREVRKGGRYLVDLKGRAMVVTEAQLTPVDEPKRKTKQSDHASQAPTRADARASIDLHGMTSDEAVHALDRFLSDALLASLDEVRIVHGRSGGRLKAAVHGRLRELPAVAAFRVDPSNPGVTIVRL